MGTTESVTLVNPEEDYKKWVRSWYATFADDLRSRQELYKASDESDERHRDFWRGVGSALILHPLRSRRYIVYEGDRRLLSPNRAMFLDWLNVGHDFVSVCSKMTAISDPSESAND